MSSAPVVRCVTVDTPAERAFAIFTERIGDWWPLATHTPSEVLAADLSFVDGSLVETSPQGHTAVWGEVTEWDPPRRLALSWAPSGGPATSVVIDFEDAGGQTRVVLTHTGWEALGVRADESRTSYGGDHAWGWVLELFAFATAGGNPDTKPVFDIAPVRSGYEAVALVLEVGAFHEPAAGEWTARQVAGHVTTNAELMSHVVDDVRAERPARLHGPEDHAAGAVGRFDALPYDAAADSVRITAADLVARCVGLTEAELSTSVSTYIEHHGAPIIDGDLTLGELLEAQIQVHLPAHVEQLRDLRRPVSGAVASRQTPRAHHG